MIDKKLLLGIAIGTILSLMIFLFVLEYQSGKCLNSAEEVFSPAAKEKIIGLIKEAKESIDLEIYILSDKDIIYHLVESASRGVKIRIILEHRVELDISKVIEALEHENIQIRFSPQQYKLMHSKMMIIDRKKVLVGSINFSRSALESNKESAIIVEGKIVKKYLENFENDWREGQIINPIKK
ncbi:MAG: phospholipase D-like domain-containing protein [Candidatus Micrarchaeota archaeon]|nr:phospholipase D-like domain-containing protein [Candidatus Micrarchaeota archaeon]